MVDCAICQEPTANTATKRCDRCWELEKRIQADPQLAASILEHHRNPWRYLCGLMATAIREEHTLEEAEPLVARYDELIRSWPYQ